MLLIHTRHLIIYKLFSIPFFWWGGVWGGGYTCKEEATDSLEFQALEA